MTTPVIFANSEYVAGRHVFKTIPGGSNMSLASLATTATCNVMTLLDDKLGIGTTVPRQALHVVGNVLTTGTLTASNVSVIGDFVTLNTVTSNTEQMVITNAGTGPGLKVTQSGNESIAEFYDDGGVLALKIADGGNVGIGTATPLAPLHVQGNALFSGFVSAGNLGMFRNVVINGNMDIWQRGTPLNAVVSGSYTADRWWVVTDGVGTVNVSQQNILGLVPGTTYCLRAERSAGVSNRWVIGTNFETSTVNQLRGFDVTLSFYVRKGSGLTSSIYVSINSISTEAKFGTATNIANATIPNASLTTSFVKYSLTGSIPLASNFPGLDIEFQGQPQVGVTNAYFEITGVQLEKGTLATPFEVRPYAIELQLCQRYYEIITFAPNGGNGAAGWTAYAWSGSGNWQWNYRFKVQKRSATNTVTNNSGINYSANITINAYSSDDSSFNVNFSASSQYTWIGGNPAGNIVINAEL